jgi:hypothetical protein
MRLTELARSFSPTVWLFGALAAVVFLLAAWWVVIGGPAHDRKAAAVARADAAFARTRADAAADAAVINDQAHETAAQYEALTKETADAIQAAKGADQLLSPDLNRAARERLCQRAGLRGTPGCVQLLGPAKPAG